MRCKLFSQLQLLLLRINTNNPNRFFRFFPDGTLLYRTSPLTVNKVAKSMMVTNLCGGQQHSAGGSGTTTATRPAAKYEQHVHSGRYVVKVRWH